MKKALLTLLVFGVAAGATIAGETTPSNNPQSSACPTATAPSYRIQVSQSTTDFFQVLAWAIAPTIQHLLGTAIVPPDITWMSGVLYRRMDRAGTPIPGNQQKSPAQPAVPDARPRPHTESSERAVPSLPDG